MGRFQSYKCYSISDDYGKKSIPVLYGNANDFETLPDKFKACLTKKEVNRAKKFYHKQDADVYCLVHGITNFLIAKRAKKEPNEVRIEYFSNQKPYVINGADFNISHSGDFFSVILSDHSELNVGVDIEKVNLDKNYEDILQDYMHHEEIEYINADDISTLEHRLRFYEIWTRKEAFLKMIGLGITTQLESINVSFSKTAFSINVPDFIEKEIEKSYLSTVRGNDFVLSVCLSHDRSVDIQKVTSEHGKIFSS